MLVDNGGRNACKSDIFKRSLFNKPTWSKPTHNLDNTALFHRSNKSCITVASDIERLKQRNEAQKRKEGTHRESNLGSSSKRIRIHDDDDDENNDSDDYDDDDYDGIDATNHAVGENQIGDRRETTSNPPLDCTKGGNISSDVFNAVEDSEDLGLGVLEPKNSLLLQYEVECAKNHAEESVQQKSRSVNVIDLEEDENTIDDEHWDGRSIVETLISTQTPSYDDSPMDEEFPELARQARERARRKRLEEDITTHSSDAFWLARQEKRPQRIQESNTITTKDPVLQILITSPIENARPLVVNRRLSQRLKDVRLAWVAHQSFGPDFADMIFLTWRGNRLFDVTSCKSLGINVDESGHVSSNDDVLGDGEGRVHMEAMTAKILAAYKTAKKEEINHKSEVQGTGAKEPETPSEVETQIRIILKAKGFDHFKLVVRPTTFISKILNAFRSANHIESQREVYLLFDGERLSPDCKVEETELSDMDHLDVYVK